MCARVIILLVAMIGAIVITMQKGVCVCVCLIGGDTELPHLTPLHPRNKKHAEKFIRSLLFLTPPPPIPPRSADAGASAASLVYFDATEDHLPLPEERGTRPSHAKHAQHAAGPRATYHVASSLLFDCTDSTAIPRNLLPTVSGEGGEGAGAGRVGVLWFDLVPLAAMGRGLFERISTCPRCSSWQ